MKFAKRMRITKHTHNCAHNIANGCRLKVRGDTIDYSIVRDIDTWEGISKGICLLCVCVAKVNMNKSLNNKMERHKRLSLMSRPW